MWKIKCIGLHNVSVLDEHLKENWEPFAEGYDEIWLRYYID